MPQGSILRPLFFIAGAGERRFRIIDGELIRSLVEQSERCLTELKEARQKFEEVTNRTATEQAREGQGSTSRALRNENDNDAGDSAGNGNGRPDEGRPIRLEAANDYPNHPNNPLCKDLALLSAMLFMFYDN